MSDPGTIVIVGGTSEFGKRIAKYYLDKGYKAVLTSRSAESARAVADEVGGESRGIALDIAKPETIRDSLAGVEDVSRLVVLAVVRDHNLIGDYNITGATLLSVMKLVGYPETIHALLPQMREDASILLYGGLAKDRPYPGSITVTSVNGAVMTMIASLAGQLAPIRINAIHPAVIGDSPFWADKPQQVLDHYISQTPLGRLVTVDEVVDASIFLLENTGMTGTNLNIDGGWLTT